MASGLHIVEGGDEAAGFRITQVTATRSVRVESWGYWSRDVATAFARDVLAALRRAGEHCDFAFDAVKLKPQGVDGQASLRLVMDAMPSMTFTRAVVVTGDILTRMQLTRLAGECGVDSVLRFTEPSP